MKDPRTPFVETLLDPRITPLTDKEIIERLRRNVEVLQDLDLENRKKISALTFYKVQWQSIAGAANLKGLVNDNHDLKQELTWACNNLEYEINSAVDTRVQAIRCKWDLV